MIHRPWLPTLLVGLSLTTMAGCGRPPVSMQQAVSPCIELPKAAGLDGRGALLAMLEADFKLKDVNKDNVVTLAEAVGSSDRPNLLSEPVFRAFKIRDGLKFDDLGKRLPEFFAWAEAYRGQLLDRYDKNRDHALSFDEVKGLFGIDEDSFKQADAVKPDTPGDGDGKLNADEFLALVLNRNAAEPGCSASTATLRRPAAKGR